MLKIFIVIDTQFRGKKYLLEFPFTDNTLDYLKNKTHHVGEQKMTLSNDNLLQIGRSNISIQTEMLQDELVNLFSIEQKKRGSFIFDIIIQDQRFISYPTWINNNQYFSVKKNEDETIEEDVPGDMNEEFEKNIINLNKEENDKAIRVKMFNIVIVLNKNFTMGNQRYMENAYATLEAFSRYLLFEEYRGRYLGHEFLLIIKYYEKCFSPHELQGENEISLDNFVKILSRESNFFKCLQNFFSGMKKMDFVKITINNWMDYKFFQDLKQGTDREIKQYHSLIITKTTKVREIFTHSSDVNPLLLIFIERTSPYKTLMELSLECNIELGLVVNFANQLISWGLARKIFKLHNHSTFKVNPNATVKIRDEICFQTCFESNIYHILNNFSLSQPGTPIEKLYVDYFKSNFDNEKYLKVLLWLVENEYLIQCSTVIFSKLPLKFRYNPERLLMQNAQVVLIKNEKIDFFIEDFDTNQFIQAKSEGELYFEDFLNSIKKTPDFTVLYTLSPLFGEKMFIDEICHFSGYKVKTVMDIIQKYYYIFETIVIPVSEEDA